MKKILLVDDDFHLRRSLELGLRSLGYAVTAAVDAIEAMQFIERNIYDVVVTDVMMPGPSGFELAQKVHDVKPDLPVIFITANDLQAGLHHHEGGTPAWHPASGQSVVAGGDGVLPAPILLKPFVLSELVNLFEFSAETSR